jgi:hypothetical protein
MSMLRGGRQFFLRGRVAIWEVPMWQEVLCQRNRARLSSVRQQWHHRFSLYEHRSQCVCQGPLTGGSAV